MPPTYFVHTTIDTVHRENRQETDYKKQTKPEEALKNMTNIRKMLNRCSLYNQTAAVIKDPSRAQHKIGHELRSCNKKHEKAFC